MGSTSIDGIGSLSGRTSFLGGGDGWLTTPLLAEDIQLFDSIVV